MVDTLLRIAAADWDVAVRGLGVKWGDRVVVLGSDSGVVAERLLLADSPPLSAAGPLVAILGDDPVSGDIERAHPAAVPLETGSVSVAIAVHAWRGRAELAGVVTEAHRLVRAGGSVVLAELDVPKLARSTPRQYSSVLVRHIAPEAASTVAASCVTHSDLEMELTRAGFEGVVTDRVDFARGLFADRAAQAAAVAEGLWRGTVGLDEEERSDLAAAALRLGDTGVVVDREPWVLVRGFRRE